MELLLALPIVLLDGCVLPNKALRHLWLQGRSVRVGGVRINVKLRQDVLYFFGVVVEVRLR